MPESEEIKQLLKTRNIGKNLVCFDRLDSTNSYLKAAADNMPDGTVVLAREQLAGRGRRGKQWAEADEHSICMSVLIKNGDFTKMPPVSLICGLAVARALKKCCGSDFFVKWPNDIICSDKKVCGILCEARLTKSGGAAVCGIGVNVLHTADFFEKCGLAGAASLFMLCQSVPASERIIAAILNELEASLDWAEECPNGFFEAYSAICCTLGKEVTVYGELSSFNGVAQSVNPDGSLTVMTDDGPTTVHSGDVSLRTKK